jgi:nicotinamide mononucleotide transporter
MNSFEIVAAIFGVISVFLSVRQNIWSWPTAIVNVGMYIVVFYRSKLYSDTGLQVVYVILNF